MTRREAREAEQRRAALLAQHQEEQERVAAQEAAPTPAYPPSGAYPGAQPQNGQYPGAQPQNGQYPGAQAPIRYPNPRPPADQWPAEPGPASRMQAYERGVQQQPAAYHPAEPLPAPQWSAAQETARGAAPEAVRAEPAAPEPFRWQLDPVEPTSRRRDAGSLPTDDDEPQLWLDDADDDEASHRLSRSERRALKHDGYGDEHDRPKRRGGWGCLVGLLIVAALGAGAYFFLQGPISAVIERFTPAEDFTGSGTTEHVFMIHEGDTGSDIAENLVSEGVTASYDAFYDLLLKQTPEPEFHPGAYRLAEQMSAQAALDALVDPANKMENTFVIQEGMWASNALAEAAAVTGIPLEQLQAAAANPQAYGLPAEATSIEGFLFPATYTVDPGATADGVIKMLVDRSFQALDTAGVAPEDRWRTVVKASLIEREAGLRDDYYKVSRVIENRLNPEFFESGLLQFDSTVHYGLGDDSVVTTTDAEREDPANPYNTYMHPGLPPGPIGNPGDLAIDAAIHPADGPWLYFVTVDLDTGETVFSSTIEEHEAAVDQFLAWLDEHPEYGN